MPDVRLCPQCGSELPADVPQGVCPRCLIGLGLAPSVAGNLSGGDLPSSAATELSSSPRLPAAEATSPYQPTTRFVPPEPAALAPLFPQLEILELLGQGGMGAVYKARQPRLNRLVALKILPAEVAADPAFAERFTREAQALARLNHPHIVGVYDFGQTAPQPVVPGSPPAQGSLYYFLMEYVDGANLRQILRAGQFTPREALAIVPQICDALQYAHDEGFVHRDIKPENILLDKRGRVKIADFGLAKLLGRGPTAPFGSRAADSPTLDKLTHSGQVMGTPQYMAPEQIERPADVDHRADIYSLGVVFYEMLTGELPIGWFAPPSQKVQVDVRLDDVVLRSLEKEPQRRYQHASDVKTDLESIARAAPVHSTPPATAAAPSPLAATTAPAAAAAPLDLDDAQAQVRLPAICLMVVGILHTLLSCGVTLPALGYWLMPWHAPAQKLPDPEPSLPPRNLLPDRTTLPEVSPPLDSAGPGRESQPSAAAGTGPLPDTPSLPLEAPPPEETRP